MQVFLKTRPQQWLEDLRAAILLRAANKVLAFGKMVAARRQFLRTREAVRVLQRCTGLAPPHLCSCIRPPACACIESDWVRWGWGLP
jgi:hypothetical protein